MPSARILVLDDDKLILQLVSDALTSDGFEVTTALSAAEAMAAAMAEKFDLVVCDIAVPDLTGFSFRDDMRRLPGREKIPFVFFSAGSPAVEMQIAQHLKGDRLLLKPATSTDIRRVVYVGLKLARVERGDLPDALPRILGRLADDRETGILSVRGGTSEKRVVVQDGKIAFAASNDPRDLIGQVFVRAGLISEKELSEAFRVRDENARGGQKQPLGTVLTALRKVTPEQCEKVFNKKIRETLLDLFLWKKGAAEFVSGGVEDADKPFPLAVDIRSIVSDGLKRRSRWAEVQRTLPDPAVRFERKGTSWPKGFPGNPGDRVLVQHIESKRTMAEILVELRGQDFAVGARLCDLVKSGVIVAVASTGFSGATSNEAISIDIDDALATMEEEESLPHANVEHDLPEVVPGTRVLETPVTIPGIPDIGEISDADLIPAHPEHHDEPPLVKGSMHPAGPSDSTIGILTRALVLMRAGDLAAARDGLASVLAVDPMNPLARQRIAEIDATLLSTQQAEQGLGPDEKVKLAVPIHELVGRAIPAKDAFLLSRLAVNALSVRELIQICPMPEVEVRRTVSAYLDARLLKRV